MDALEEYLDDKLNLKIEIKEENDILSSVPPETNPIKGEPWPVDLNKVKWETETLGKPKLYYSQSQKLDCLFQTLKEKPTTS